MLINKKSNSILVKIAGVLILGHGLFHIIFIGDFIDFVMSNFFNDLPYETVFVIGSSVFPFIEFFIGLLLLFKIKLRKTLLYSMLIYMTLIVLTILDANYQLSAYLFIILSLLLYVYLNTTPSEVIKRII